LIVPPGESCVWADRGARTRTVIVSPLEPAKSPPGTRATVFARRRSRTRRPTFSAAILLAVRSAIVLSPRYQKFTAARTAGCVVSVAAPLDRGFGEFGGRTLRLRVG